MLDCITGERADLHPPREGYICELTEGGLEKVTCKEFQRKPSVNQNAWDGLHMGEMFPQGP